MSRFAALLVIFAGFAGLAGLVGCGRDVRIIETVNENQAIQKEFFLGHIAGIDYYRGELKIRWKPQNRFGRPAGVQEPVVVGTEYTAVDHHANQRYTVHSVTEGSFVIDYVSSFDHRSFGHDKITVDRGRFTVRWQDANR